MTPKLLFRLIARLRAGSMDEAAEGVDMTIKKLGETVAKAAPPPRVPQV